MWPRVPQIKKKKEKEKKSSKILKILGARKVTCSEFSAEDRKIFDLKVQNVVVTAICHLEFVYP